MTPRQQTQSTPEAHHTALVKASSAGWWWGEGGEGDTQLAVGSGEDDGGDAPGHLPAALPRRTSAPAAKGDAAGNVSMAAPRSTCSAGT